MKKSKLPVAICVPIYKMELTEDEKMSLFLLKKFLSKYPVYVFGPKQLPLNNFGFKVKEFDSSYFKSTDTYSQLMLSKHFYEAFIDYKYILIYQLDVLVFRDELMEWCQKDYDYIGGPWMKDVENFSKGFAGAGNGGLSLRKIESFLKVLNSQRYKKEKVNFWKELLCQRFNEIQNSYSGPWLIKKIKILREVRKGIDDYIKHYSLPEDLFWGKRAFLFDPQFKVASEDVAIKFSFNMAPKYCYEKNNYQLPFGCHGWARWDKIFWNRFLKLKFKEVEFF